LRKTNRLPIYTLASIHGLLTSPSLSKDRVAIVDLHGVLVEYPRERIYSILISRLPVEETVKARLQVANEVGTIRFEDLVHAFPDPEREYWRGRLSAVWQQLASFFMGGRAHDGVELLRLYPGSILIVTVSGEHIVARHVLILESLLDLKRTYVVAHVQNKKDFFDLLASNGVRVAGLVGDNAEDIAYPDQEALKILVKRKWTRVPNDKSDPVIVDSTRTAFEILLNSSLPRYMATTMQTSEYDPVETDESRRC